MSEVRCLLGAAAEERPQGECVVMEGRVWSFREVNRAVNRRAAVLGQLRERFPKARRIALLLPNTEGDSRVAALWTLLAAGRAGWSALMVDGRLPPAMIREVLPEGQGIVAVRQKQREWKDQAVEAVTWEELAETESRVELSEEEAERTEFSWDPEGEATGVLTSGSTGMPKLCVQTFGNHYYSALGSNENIPLEVGDRWLLSLPLYHVGGMGIVYRALLAGAVLAIGEQGGNLNEQVKALGVTHCSMVPTQLQRYVANGGMKEKLKAVLIGGAAAPRAVVEAAVDRGLPVFTSYGLTEMSSQVTTTGPGDARERLFGSGKVLPYRELRIDESGEILVRGRTLSPGYLERDGVRGIADEKGWFHTGDMGEVDAEGYLQVTGRQDNMLVSGGENVQPELVERGLLEVPDVIEAVVVAVEDKEYGQRPFGFVSFAERDPREYAKGTRLVRDYVLMTGGRADVPVQVREMLKEKMPGYAVPVRIAGIPEEAREGLKVDRRYLERVARELYGAEPGDSR